MLPPAARDTNYIVSVQSVPKVIEMSGLLKDEFAHSVGEWKNSMLLFCAQRHQLEQQKLVVSYSRSLHAIYYTPPPFY